MTAGPDAVRSCDWLAHRPIAHRGLHDRQAGRIENSISAARAAIEAGFGIECDVQPTRDGRAVVFHDFTLERLTGLTGPVADRTAAELGGVALAGSDDRIVGLDAFLAFVAGRVPVLCEIKSRFDGDLRLADHVAEVSERHAGALALKSFDPAVVAHLRQRIAPDARRPLGIVAAASYDHPEWAMLDAAQKRRLAALAHLPETRPDFLSYDVGDLPHAAATLFRPACGGPVLTWTVRTPAQRAVATAWADQMIFEGFRP